MSQFRELQGDLVSCMHDRGWSGYEVVYDAGGEWMYQTPDENDSSGPDHTACAESTGIIEVEPLYSEIRVNPERRDVNELWAACLVEVGAVDPGYSGRDLASAISAGTDVVGGAPDPEVASDCLVNPEATMLAHAK